MTQFFYRIVSFLGLLGRVFINYADNTRALYIRTQKKPSQTYDYI